MFQVEQKVFLLFCPHLTRGDTQASNANNSQVNNVLWQSNRAWIIMAAFDSPIKLGALFEFLVFMAKKERRISITIIASQLALHCLLVVIMRPELPQGCLDIYNRHLPCMVKCLERYAKYYWLSCFRYHVVNSIHPYYQSLLSSSNWRGAPQKTSNDDRAKPHLFACCNGAIFLLVLYQQRPLLDTFCAKIVIKTLARSRKRVTKMCCKVVFSSVFPHWCCC